VLKKQIIKTEGFSIGFFSPNFPGGNFLPGIKNSSLAVIEVAPV